MSPARPGPAGSRVGRHAADEAEVSALTAPAPWWRRLLPGARAATGDQVVIRVHGDLDDTGAARFADHVRAGCVLQPHQVVVVHLADCGFVDVRGLRALLVLQDDVARHAGRLLVLDPPRTLRIMCRAVPGRLVLVPEGTDAGPPAG